MFNFKDEHISRLGLFLQHQNPETSRNSQRFRCLFSGFRFSQPGISCGSSHSFPFVVRWVDGMMIPLHIPNTGFPYFSGGAGFCLSTAFSTRTNKTNLWCVLKRHAASTRVFVELLSFLAACCWGSKLKRQYSKAANWTTLSCNGQHWDVKRSAHSRHWRGPNVCQSVVDRLSRGSYFLNPNPNTTNWYPFRCGGQNTKKSTRLPLKGITWSGAK